MDDCWPPKLTYFVRASSQHPIVNWFPQSSCPHPWHRSQGACTLESGRGLKKPKDSSSDGKRTGEKRKRCTRLKLEKPGVDVNVVPRPLLSAPITKLSDISDMSMWNETSQIEIYEMWNSGNKTIVPCIVPYLRSAHVWVLYLSD